jgi:carboxylesterase type B
MSTPRFVVHSAAIAFALAGTAAFGQSQKAADPAATAPPAANGPIVRVRQGEAQGIVADGVAVFKGLPFAAPPVGDLRWREPQLPAKWSGVRAANAYSSTCMQAEVGLAHGGELAYVFNTPRTTPFDEEGNAVAGAANRYWAQFAKTGDPDSAGGPPWPKFDTADEYVMEFPASGVPLAAKHFHKDRLDWVEAGLAK